MRPLGWWTVRLGLSSLSTSEAVRRGGVEGTIATSFCASVAGSYAIERDCGIICSPAMYGRFVESCRRMAVPVARIKMRWYLDFEVGMWTSLHVVCDNS